ncbi:MFS general substrate transporter [Lepidopterella palustris CBS 459.81]|uniref:MFS general substrate transporter n=1 Tax=Lepidopterella palustris CBS 459.81 TaxID=1314670 RepID=A0A8E2JG69_9PEZI|nr:MFS general substrate transporter [Lepidopterella palustris CBS 459.81]
MESSESLDPASPITSKDEIPLRKFSISSESSSGSEESHLLFNEDLEWRQKLPPVDRGAGAWKFLLGCWLIEAMLWGFPLAFGIFQSHYSSHPLFSSSKYIPTVGALAVGISYLGVPITSPFTLRYPQYHLHILFSGWLLCILGLVLASFATKTWHLLLTQGAMYGVGWVICYTPFLIMLNDWFESRRGLAYGILFGASGVSGLILPFLLETLIGHFDFRVTLRTYAFLCILVSGPSFLLVRPRIPAHLQPPLQRSSMPKRSFNFLKNQLTYVFGISILLQGLAFPLPPTFLPSYALGLSLSHSTGDILLAVNSLAQVTGQILLGHFSDNVSIHLPHSISCFISGLSCLLVWGSAGGLSSLVAFAALWGAFGGSYSVSWTKIAAGMAQEEEPGRRAEATMTLYAWFSFERGVADILAGPISSVLLGDEVVEGTYGLRKWRGVVVFSGTVLLASSLGGFGWRWERWVRGKGRSGR